LSQTDGVYTIVRVIATELIFKNSSH